MLLLSVLLCGQERGEIKWRLGPLLLLEVTPRTAAPRVVGYGTRLARISTAVCMLRLERRGKEGAKRARSGMPARDRHCVITGPALRHENRKVALSRCAAPYNRLWVVPSRCGKDGALGAAGARCAPARAASARSEWKHQYMLVFRRFFSARKRGLSRLRLVSFSLGAGLSMRRKRRWARTKRASTRCARGTKRAASAS